MTIPANPQEDTPTRRGVVDPHPHENINPSPIPPNMENSISLNDDAGDNKSADIVKLGKLAGIPEDIGERLEGMDIEVPIDVGTMVGVSDNFERFSEAMNSGLGMEEAIFAQMWVKYGGRVTVVMERMSVDYNLEVSRKWVDRVLGKGVVKEYMLELMRERGIDVQMTKERWIAEAIAYRDGLRVANKVTVAMHEMIGKAKGYFGGVGSGVSINQTIKLVQGDGKE